MLKLKWQTSRSSTRNSVASPMTVSSMSVMLVYLNNSTLSYTQTLDGNMGFRTGGHKGEKGARALQSCDTVAGVLSQSIIELNCRLEI